MEEYDVFISYRSKDNHNGRDFLTANNIYTYLSNNGYKNKVYMDKYDRDMHETQEIFEHLKFCKDFILILSEDTFENCSDENDWVRQEIDYALKSRMNIIPVSIVIGYHYPQNLPYIISDIGRKGYVNFSENYIEDTFENIVSKMKATSSLVRNQINSNLDEKNIFNKICNTFKKHTKWIFTICLICVASALFVYPFIEIPWGGEAETSKQEVVSEKAPEEMSEEKPKTKVKEEDLGEENEETTGSEETSVVIPDTFNEVYPSLESDFEEVDIMVTFVGKSLKKYDSMIDRMEESQKLCETFLDEGSAAFDKIGGNLDNRYKAIEMKLDQVQDDIKIQFIANNEEFQKEELDAMNKYFEDYGKYYLDMLKKLNYFITNKNYKSSDVKEVIELQKEIVNHDTKAIGASALDVFSKIDRENLGRLEGHYWVGDCYGEYDYLWEYDEEDLKIEINEVKDARVTLMDDLDSQYAYMEKGLEENGSGNDNSNNNLYLEYDLRDIYLPEKKLEYIEDEDVAYSTVTLNTKQNLELIMIDKEPEVLWNIASDYLIEGEYDTAISIYDRIDQETSKLGLSQDEYIKAAKKYVESMKDGNSKDGLIVTGFEPGSNELEEVMKKSSNENLRVGDIIIAVDNAGDDLRKNLFDKLPMTGNDTFTLTLLRLEDGELEEVEIKITKEHTVMLINANLIEINN